MTQLIYTTRGQRTVIGQCSPVGLCLDKAALCAMPRHTDRLRAYLLAVWPGVRRAKTIAAVCNVPYKSVATLLRGDIRDGDVTRPALGQYKASPKWGQLQREEAG